MPEAIDWPRLILASTSPRRKALLRQAGISFRAVDSGYEENMRVRLSPAGLVRKLSRGKAEAVARKLKKGIVLGADTVVVFRGKVLGKPHTVGRARRMLRQLRGKHVQVMTGFTLINASSGARVSKAVTGTVVMRGYSDAEINTYIKSGEPLERAGAFAIQGQGRRLIRRIIGDRSAIVGLPVAAVVRELHRFGLQPGRIVGSAQPT